MSTFREYLEFSELEENIDEGLLSTLGGIADAGISGIGTVGKQFVRGLGNTAWGGVKAAASGAGSVFGSPESRKQSRRDFGSNLRQVGRGVAQVAGAIPSGLVRGVEAGTNPFSAMKSGDKGGWGEMFGTRGEYAPPWQELISKLNSTKDRLGTLEDKNERIKIISQMKKFYPTQYKELERKDREKREKMAKMASAEPYILPKVPESSFFDNNMSQYIEDIYKAHEQGKRLVVNDERPEVFIKKLMIAYLNSREKNQELDVKLKTILREYFGQIKIKKLNTPEDLNIELSKGNISKISNYINSVYLSIKKEDEIMLPKDKDTFIKNLTFIRDKILSPDGFNKNLHQKIEELRNKANEIINNYNPGGVSHYDTTYWARGTPSYRDELTLD